MKTFLLALTLITLSSGFAQAQVYTGDGTVAPPPAAVGQKYRLRDPYYPYPGYPPVAPNTSPDTAEVGRPYYYPYGYPYGYPYPYPGVTSDGNSVYVPGK
ncbi:hypothetical protein FBR05_01270 [Deltaproteobacteria bacterium PRO3]|nr:hypothetical protein [Deltaproteobacteria bacterium PRO3]